MFASIAVLAQMLVLLAPSLLKNKQGYIPVITKSRPKWPAFFVFTPKRLLASEFEACKTAFGGFFVYRWEVLARALHGIYDVVERHQMTSVAKQ